VSAVNVIGRSELLESAHAPIHDQSGEVVGGMALVRVLPTPTPTKAPEELAPPAVAAGENGAAGRPPNRLGAPGRVPGLGDIDWLGFN
jgi:hypothetical protein